MKKGTLIAGLFIFTSSLAFAAIPIPAEDRGMELAPGWYGAANVRANFIENANLKQVDTSRGGKIKFDPGAGFGVRGGYRFCQYFALEGETGFTGNSIRSMTGASVDADLLQVPFMANAVFSFPLQYGLAPFFGTGIGGTTSVIDADHITVNGPGGRTAIGSESTTSFAYQFFAGVHYAITERISVGAIYNYRNVDGPKWDRGGFPIETGELRNHSIGVSANFRF